MSQRKAQAAATRELLLAAAHRVFEERGYQATTVGAITTEADTAHGTFYLYFRNKEDVFTKVVEGVIQEMYDHTWGPVLSSSRLMMENTIRGWLEVFVHHAAIWRCLIEGTFTAPAIEEAWRELRVAFISRTARTLAQLQEAGRVRADLDVERTANALGSMMEWTATTEFVLRMAPAETVFEETVATLTDVWYHALFVDR